MSRQLLRTAILATFAATGLIAGSAAAQDATPSGLPLPPQQVPAAPELPRAPDLPPRDYREATQAWQQYVALMDLIGQAREKEALVLQKEADINAARNGGIPRRTATSRGLDSSSNPIVNPSAAAPAPPPANLDPNQFPEKPAEPPKPAPKPEPPKPAPKPVEAPAAKLPTVVAINGSNETGWLASIELDGQVAQLRVGEKAGPWQVVSIKPEAVEVRNGRTSRLLVPDAGLARMGSRF